MMKTFIVGLIVISIAVIFLWRGNFNIINEFCKLSAINNNEKFENITKSLHDKRLYRGLKLHNNLKVLLISDPTTDISAASLTVGVGSINDFEELPGLAHFLEHMLFMGSKKYPSVNDFMKFISDHAGYTNAFTDVCVTNYQFRVSPDSLVPTLDRFANFFIDPLMNETAIEKEVNAVNSEHKIYISDDQMRIEQLEISMSKANHSFNHFYVGNLETLYTLPRSRGISVRDKLLQFHSTWYSSNIMTLAVLGKESLNKLEKTVTSLFENVEDKQVEKVVYSYKDHPWGPEQLKRKICIVPLADIHFLKLIFPTPDVVDQYRTAPEDYLCNLIGHEGRGSLLSLLREKRLCSSVASSYKSNVGFGFFEVQFGLTKEAMNHSNTSIDEIITLTFQYINLLKSDGIQKRFFEENKKISEIAFLFKDKEAPLSYVETLTTWMHNYPIEDILSFKFLRDRWEPSLIEQFLTYLRPDNMNVVIVSKSFENIAEETEKWYGTKYKIDKIPDDLIKKWKAAKPSSELQLPLPNEFIPEHFDLYSLEKSKEKYPYVIHESSLSRIWFKQDDKFKLPKLDVRFEILSPISSLNPKNRNLLEMFVILFRDSFNEYAYPATQAELEWYISTTDNGICIKLFGYNEKLPILLEKLILKMVKFKVDKKRLEILKESYIRSLKNFETEELYINANIQLRYLMNERCWTNEELLAATEILQSEKIEEFQSRIFSYFYIQGLIHGNCNKKKAKEIINIIESPFRSTHGVVPSQLLQLRQMQIDDGSNLKYEVFNEYHPNSCCLVYFQCSTESVYNNTLMELFVQIIDEPCFNILRTQEQLGYIAYCAVRRVSGVQGFVVLVESEKHPLYVHSRIEEFLRTIHKMLEDMTEKEFKAHKKALTMKKLETPKRLEKLSDKYWGEITSRLYNYERQEKEVKQLNSIKKKDILEFYKKWVLESSDRRRKVAVHVISNITNPTLPDNLTIKFTKIESVAAFRNASKFLPLPSPYMKITDLGTQPKL